MGLAWITNTYLWMGLTFLFFLLFILVMVVLVFISKKTHAMVEFKAWRKGHPIALFFQDNRFCEWKPVEPDAGIINDKDYGAYIISSTYVDKKTKNVLIPFDAAFGASVNVKAAKLADDLRYVVRDERQMANLREAIATNKIKESETIEALKTSVNFGAIKGMMTALIPHNINAKIEKVIASRMKGFGNVNVPQIAMLFAAVFGAILLGALIIKLAFPAP